MSFISIKIKILFFLFLGISIISFTVVAKGYYNEKQQRYVELKELSQRTISRLSQNLEVPL